jgi:hypothetical protein
MNVGNSDSIGISKQKSARILDDVNEVVVMMRDNIGQTLEREEKLSHLQEQTSRLQDSAFEFKTQTRSLQRQIWWEGAKMNIIILLLVMITIVVLMFWLIW